MDIEIHKTITLPTKIVVCGDECEGKTLHSATGTPEMVIYQTKNISTSPIESDDVEATNLFGEVKLYVQEMDIKIYVYNAEDGEMVYDESFACDCGLEDVYDQIECAAQELTNLLSDPCQIPAW